MIDSLMENECSSTCSTVGEIVSQKAKRHTIAFCKEGFAWNQDQSAVRVCVCMSFQISRSTLGN